MRRRRSCGPASGRHCCAAASRSRATPPCAASACCCSVHPSAPWTRSVWTCCTSIFRRWISRRILPRQTPAAWSCCARRHWPKRWSTPTRTRISAPLPTCTARAAPTNRRGTPSCRCMISCGHCRTTTASWTNFWLHGSRKTALTPPAGMTCCWRRQPAMQRQPASCCAPPSRTAGRTMPRKWRRPEKKRPRRPSGKRKRRWPKNTPTRRAVWNALPPCWARWSGWHRQGSGRPCMTGSPFLCWAWKSSPA